MTLAELRERYPGHFFVRVNHPERSVVLRIPEKHAGKVMKSAPVCIEMLDGASVTVGGRKTL